MNEHDIAEVAFNNGYEKGRAEAAPKWISVNVRLPEFHKEVLTHTKMGTSGHSYDVAHLELVDNELGWVTLDGFVPQYIAEVTHWMPMPEPPKGE